MTKLRKGVTTAYRPIGDTVMAMGEHLGIAIGKVARYKRNKDHTCLGRIQILLLCFVDPVLEVHLY